jgi:ADP-dependent NAD(P)H-hydrate dehydratase
MMVDIALTTTTEIDARLLRDWPLPQPGGSADKEERGATLVVAGGSETRGAAALAAVSALRAGAGKLIVATVESVAAGLAHALPEARVIALPETADGGIAPAALGKIEALLALVDAVLIGPGLQDAAATRAFAKRIVKRTPRAAIVLDALAMDTIMEMRRFERTAILTPHAGEMAHLTAQHRGEISADPERHAREAAARWNAVVVLKGGITYIATPDGTCWRHDGRQPGLGTSGSGDALAGIIGGLAARGATPAQAAVWGVAVHARAGRALAERLGPVGYLASELPGEVPRVLQRLAS